MGGMKKCIHSIISKGKLSIVDGVILKGSRVVVPTSLRKHMMTIAHEGHFGIVKCQSRARQVLYWPNMNSNIETMVNRCETCQKHRYQQQKEPLTQHYVPTLPWTKIAADLFTLRNKNYMYLIVIDYTSNYPEMIQLRDTTATSVIMAMKSTMSRFGIPREVVSDNGPQFSSQEFSAFARMYGFKHSTSSPYFAQSNGKAEKGVQIVKRLMTKSIESDEDIHLAMLSYRCAPYADGKSPAEILFGRRLRTRLPSVQFHKYSEKPSNLKQKLSYDKTAKILHPLKVDDPVRIRHDGQWEQQAKVVEQVDPHSYRVETPHGAQYRRNRKDLLRTADAPSSASINDNSKDNNNISVQMSNCQGQSQSIDDKPVIRSSGRMVKKPERYVEVCPIYNCC